MKNSNEKIEKTEISNIDAAEFVNAAAKRDINTLKAMVLRDSKIVNALSSEKTFKNTALHYLIYYYQKNALQDIETCLLFLLENGADPRIKNAKGKSVIDLINNSQDILSDVKKSFLALCGTAENVLTAINIKPESNSQLKLNPILLFENHTNAGSYLFLKICLPMLKKLGYKAISLEIPTHTLTDSLELPMHTITDLQQVKSKYKRLIKSYIDVSMPKSETNNCANITNSIIEYYYTEDMLKKGGNHHIINYLIANNALKIIELAEEHGLQLLCSDPRIGEAILKSGDPKIKLMQENKDELFIDTTLRELGFFHNIDNAVSIFDGGVIAINGLNHSTAMLNLFKQNASEYKVMPLIVCEDYKSKYVTHQLILELNIIMLQGVVEKLKEYSSMHVFAINEDNTLELFTQAYIEHNHKTKKELKDQVEEEMQPITQPKSVNKPSYK